MYLSVLFLKFSMQIMSLIILGTSTALGHPLLLGSFAVTVLRKDSHTRDETLWEW